MQRRTWWVSGRVCEGRVGSLLSVCRLLRWSEEALSRCQGSVLQVGVARRGCVQEIMDIPRFVSWGLGSIEVVRRDCIQESRYVGCFPSWGCDLNVVGDVGSSLVDFGAMSTCTISRVKMVGWTTDCLIEIALIDVGSLNSSF